MEQQAAVGFEPTNNGFANHRLGPLGYAAIKDKNQTHNLMTKTPLLKAGLSKNRKWAGLESNQRRLAPTGLQPVPFGRSGTDPSLFKI